MCRLPLWQLLLELMFPSLLQQEGVQLARLQLVHRLEYLVESSKLTECHCYHCEWSGWLVQRCEVGHQLRHGVLGRGVMTCILLVHSMCCQWQLVICSYKLLVVGQLCTTVMCLL